MRTQKFGIEIEMTGITRAAAAQVIAGHFGTSAIHVGGGYDTYTVRDNDNRQWKLVSDSSIRLETRRGGSRNSAYSVEFVSPICRYEDIETIQELIRKLRTAGAKVNSSCGIHIHIDASPHDVKTLRNIVNIMAAKEDLLYKSLKVDVHREHYCAKADTRFLDELNAKRPTSMDTLESIWYNGQSGRNSHYDESRYHGLNLHSVFSKGTIEFRLFNSTLHAGEILLCAAVEFVGTLAIAGATDMWQLLVLALPMGFAMGALSPIMNTYILQHLPLSRSGMANAIFYAAGDMGVIIGATLWEIVSNLTSYGFMFVVAALVVLLGVLMVLFQMRFESARGRRDSQMVAAK